MPRTRSSPRATIPITFCLLSLFACAGTVSAQDDQRPTPPEPRGARDFLFGQPHGSVGVRGGWIFARAGSDLFDFVQQQLTLDKKDFNTPALGIDLSIAIKPRVDVAFGFEFSRAGKASEYRDYVDNKLLPITQDTKLHERNFTGSVRFALAPRGTTVSRFAWVPRSV
ncbi:MAG TPA: hypothetical protein VEK56_09615, partial [Vicinamibacterales bacterium]|nr:hypothetical protein [Vicinamibacterales bacterium]